MDAFFPAKVAINRVVDFLDNQTLMQHKIIWLEKTPAHLHAIEYIADNIPRAFFVHMIRDGKDVAASLFEATSLYPDEWGGARSIERCVNRWNKDIEVSMQYLGNAAHLMVRYEKLLEEPELELQRLCNFLQISFEETMMTERAKNAKAMIHSQEAWKKKNFSALSKSNKFERILDSTQQEYVRRPTADYISISERIDRFT